MDERTKKLRAQRLQAQWLRDKAKAASKRSSLPTANARIIHDTMKSKGVKGSYKDFALVAGSCVVDWTGTYPAGVETKGVQLVHKGRLVDVVDEETAERFWCKATGTRRNVNRSP